MIIKLQDIKIEILGKGYEQSVYCKQFNVSLTLRLSKNLKIWLNNVPVTKSDVDLFKCNAV